MRVQASGHPLRGARLAGLRLLWAVAAALTLGLFAAGIPGRYAQLIINGEALGAALAQLGLSVGFYAAYFTALDFVLVAMHFVVAAVIFWRRSDEWMALFVAFTLVTAPLSFIRAFGVGQSGWYALARAVNYLGLVASLSLLYVFPDGRFVPRWTLPLAALWAALNLPAVFLHDSPLSLTRWPLALQAILLVGWATSGVVAQVARYLRVSDPAQRQQTKWAVLGLTAAALGPLGYYLPFVALPSLTELNLPGLFALAGSSAGALPLFLRLAAVTALTLGMLLFPLSFAVAILRYRLWDIDLLINRSLVYGAVTGTLALVYLVLVVLLQSLFRPLAFRFQPEIVTAISTLVIAALFWPVQRRAQAAIDRHFYRRKVDAGRVLAAFNDNLRDEVNPDQIARSLLAAAQETLQPAHLALWVRRDSTGWENGAVAHLLHDAAPLPAPAVTPEDALLRRLRSVPGPLELAELNLDSPTLRSLQGSGVRLAVPLICQAELVAVLNLGLRLNGQGYSTEDFRLLNQLATQAAAALRVAQLARVEHELHVAQLIQQLLLPETGPPCPGWRITTRYVPARAVSGDFFDLVSLPDGRVGVTVGDVTDHGVPAALVMAATRSLLRAASQTCRSPGQVLAQTNELLCPDMLPKMFATCLYAILDPPTGRLQFANAGHCLPLLRGGDGVRELRATGMPLGLLPGMVYEEQEVTLAPGESILLYSDGLVEAHNPSREMFGMGRLQVLLAGAPPPDGTGWIEILMGALRAHIGPGVDQEDDVTLVMLERSPT